MPRPTTTSRRCNSVDGQVQFWMTPDIATGSESLVLHIGSETFPFQSAHTKQSNNRRWNNPA